MKKLSKMALILALLASAGIEVASAQTPEDAFYQQWVDYRDGEISVAFAQTPVVVALHVIQEKTGLQFFLPPSAESKVLNLRLERSRIEPAVISLLSSIGFRNFALMYDEKGRPNRAVVLGTQVEQSARGAAQSEGATEKAEAPVQSLTTEERDKLQKDLERWHELKQEERGRIEDRLKSMPSSEDRDQLVKEYGRRLLGIKE
ncbi:MAG: hypothetical protein GEU77_01300 [Deltaproteobacteria bacterium]|nr:hypothetical protein [Deltaproteobacteria bacterium]